jgi:FkbM family methyltransferase
MSVSSHLARKLKQLLYRLGLLVPFAQIDRHRYLRRLKRSRFLDSRYLSPHDRAQFASDEVVVRVGNQGVFSYFHCNPKSSIEGMLLSQGFFQKAVFETMSAFVKPGSLVLDIGANVGAYAIPVARAFPGCEVHGFEPNPAMAGRLRENIALNCMSSGSNLQVMPFALSDAKGQMTLYAVTRIEGNPGLSSLREESLGTAGYEAIDVAVETLDGLYGDSPQAVSVIKIDVQGHELQVLRGGQRVIERSRAAIVFEHEDGLFADAAEAAAVKAATAAFLAEVGYRAYYISRFGADLLTRVDWSRTLNGDILALPFSGGQP